MESESLHLCLGLIYGKHVMFCVYSIMRILNFQLFIVDLISVVIISPYSYPLIELDLDLCVILRKDIDR